MAEIIRDTALGQLIRLATRRRVLQYPEERPGFELPAEWLEALAFPVVESAGTSPDTAPLTTTQSLVIEGTRRLPTSSSPVDDEKKLDPASSSSGDDTDTDVETAAEPLPAQPPLVPTKTKDGSVNLITWYSASDQENPQNWSSMRKGSITLLICLYTFVVYCSSAIYSPSIVPITEVYGVSITVASLGLALFVLGYGTGPLIFSPLGEIASIGRNPIYIATMVMFFILSFPAAFVTNVPGLLVLRFLQGFFGSPCLASGAATLGDMYSINLPYALIAWVSAAYCGPALGPLLTGFSVPALGWRWSMYEILFMAAPVTFLMFALLPETSADNILLRRARRLRSSSSTSPSMTEEVKRSLYSPAEKAEAAQSFSTVLLSALVKPLQITALDPAILFVQTYTAIIYGIYYSFFEVFPLVYTTPGIYGLSVGQTGIIFLCILVACLIGMVVYVLYLRYSAMPTLMAALSGRIPMPPQESRLVPALFAAFGPTVGLFLFAWTARESIHWIVPTLGIVIYGATVFIVMQCIFVYVPMSYPHYAASLFAGNDFFRSAMAFASILFAKPLFANLGIARGTSLLGGLSTIGIMGIWALWVYGGKMRAMSRFAVSE